MSRPMNALYRNTAFLCAAAMILAACSENTTTPTPRGISPEASSADVSPEMNSPNGHGIIFPTRDWFAHNAKPSGGSNTGIYYHGGPVLQAATNVVAVYWAQTSDQPIYSNGPTSNGGPDNSLIGFFLSNLGNSSYFNINTSYTDGSGNHIANVVNYSGYWVNTSNAPTGTQNVSDADMLNMLSSGFMTGALTYDSHTLYAIFTSGAVNLGGGFGTQYCAYHWYGTVNTPKGSKTVLYAAMPYDAAYPSACTENQAPNNDFGADAEVNTLAHETEETTTDMFGTAWYDRRGYENADKCAWTFGTTHGSAGHLWNISLGGRNFLVQRNWVNAGSGGCATSY